jgi:acyl dehydratase
MVPTQVRGPYFDELTVGSLLDTAPAVALTSGMQATHQSIVGSRLRLALDPGLAVAVTGAPMAPPALVWDVSIGQSTGFTQHVMANLFYRGLSFRRFPRIGDVLSTRTTVVALKENARRPNRRPSGLAVLRIETADQDGRPVLDFWRCAMLPLAPGAGGTAATDDVAAVGSATSVDDLVASIEGWRLDLVRRAYPGLHFRDLDVGLSWEVVGADLVSSAPELARLTGNLATVHHDASAAGGARLVYGGHTIGLALHQVTRALPNLVTVVGWQHCDHLGPVHEGDLLTSTVSAEALHPLPDGGGLVQLRVTASVGGDGKEGAVAVLNWSLWAVMA